MIICQIIKHKIFKQNQRFQVLAISFLRHIEIILKKVFLYFWFFIYESIKKLIGIQVGGRVQGVEKLIEEAMQTNKFLRDVGLLENLGGDFDSEEEEDESKNTKEKKLKYPNINKMNEIRDEVSSIFSFVNTNF